MAPTAEARTSRSGAAVRGRPPLAGDATACIWTGTGASALVVVGGTVVGPGAGPHGPVLAAFGYVSAFGGVIALVGAWLWLGRIVTSSPGSSRAVVLTALGAWGLPLLCGPVLFSRDIFSYAAHGREIVAGVNPYHRSPDVLVGGPYLRLVSPTWRDARSPYGPFFLGLDTLIVRAAGLHAMAAVAVLRLLSCAGVVLAAAALSRLASSSGVDPGAALWIGVLNPLMLLHVVSGGHNEGLMIGLLMAGLVCAREGRFAGGVVLCLLAGSVKVPGALGAVYVGAQWMASCPDTAARARAAVRLAATAVATALTVTAAAGLGWGWIATVTTPTRIRTALSPTTDLGAGAARLVTGLGLRVPPAWAMSAVRLAGLAAAVTLGALLFAGRRRRPVAAGVGLTLLAVVALGPTLQPWYLLWGIVPLAAVPPGRFRPVLVFVSAGVCLLVLPNGSAVPDFVTVTFLAATTLVACVGCRERVEPVPRLAPA